jgi:hypothetical protein
MHTIQVTLAMKRKNCKGVGKTGQHLTHLNRLHYMHVTDQFYAPATLSRALNPRGHGDEINSASSRNRTPSTSLTASRS